MANSPDLIHLERDFTSGKNPLAYIPLCQGLRRQKAYVRALDFCQQGLRRDPDSIAGRTLLARLLNDLGRYQESLAEIQKAQPRAPEAMGLLVEKARCLVRLHRLDEAGEVIQQLNRRNPLDADVQDLNTQYWRFVSDRNVREQARRTMPEIKTLRTQSREILDDLQREMQKIAELKSCAVIPIGAGSPAVWGETVHVEAAFDFFKTAAAASREMERGLMKIGLVETERLQLIVLVRGQALVAVSFLSTPEFGRIFHRLTEVAERLLPEDLQR